MLIKQTVSQSCSIVVMQAALSLDLGALPEQITSQLDSGRGIFVLGASGATQTAEEREIDGNGVFTRQVIEGLRTGSADVDGDGRISLNDLAKYVRDEFRRKNVQQDPFTAGLSKSGDLILGVNRKLGHKKVVSSIRSKMEQTRSFFVKSTYRAIDDYLDEVSDSPDAGEDPRFKALAAFGAGESMEDVVVAFRGKPEPGLERRSEPKPKPKPESYVISKITAKTFAFVQQGETEPQVGGFNYRLRYIVSGLLSTWVGYFGLELFFPLFDGGHFPNSSSDRSGIFVMSAMMLYPSTAVLVVGTLRGYDWARSLGRWLVCLGLMYLLYNSRGIGVEVVSINDVFQMGRYFASASQAYSFIAYGFCVWLLAAYLYFRRWPKVTFHGLGGASRLRTLRNICMTAALGCIIAVFVFGSIVMSQADTLDRAFMLFLAGMLAYIPISKWWRFWKQRRAALTF